MLSEPEEHSILYKIRQNSNKTANKLILYYYQGRVTMLGKFDNV